MAGDPALELGQRLLRSQQIEHVLGGPDRALDPAQRVVGDEVLKSGEGHEHLVGGSGEPLAQRGGLGGDVVRATRQGQLGVGRCQPREPGQQGHGLIPGKKQGLPDLHLLDVLGQVPTGHALVDLLVAGKGTELVDAGLDVVAADPLAGRDGLKVHLVDDAPVGIDRAVGDLHSEVCLGLQNRQPQMPLGDDLVGRGPDLAHLLGCVTGSEDVGNHWLAFCAMSVR